MITLPYFLCLVRKKEKTGCVVCLNGTIFVYLKGSKKTVYMGHRRWLIRTHKYRKMADSFDGKIEKDSFASQPGTGRTVFEMCQKVKFKLVKKSKGDVDDNSKRGRRRLKVQKTLTCLSRGYLYFSCTFHTGKNWQCAMPSMGCIFRRMCLKAQSNS
jgi:hypothetical protein